MEDSNPMTPAQLKICEDLAKREGLDPHCPLCKGEGTVPCPLFSDPSKSQPETCRHCRGQKINPMCDYFTSPADTWRLVERLPKQANITFIGKETMVGGRGQYWGKTKMARLEALVNALHAYAEAGGLLEDSK